MLQDNKGRLPRATPTRTDPDTAIDTAIDTGPGFGLVEAAGPDASAFLQSQLSSDLNTLQVGGWQWSAWLSAKGRVIALMLLFRADAERIWMLLPDHPADALVAALQRFVFRRKLKLRVVDELIALPCFEPLVPHPQARIELPGRIQRRIELLPVAHAGRYSAEIARRWLEEDIRCGIPRLLAEGGTHTAHMLSLDRLHAISLSKGCYPGQEIVARTHYLGQSKRRLGALISVAPDAVLPAAGTQVLLNDTAFAEVVVAVRSGDGRALAQVVQTAAAEGPSEGCNVRIQMADTAGRAAPAAAAAATGHAIMQSECRPRRRESAQAAPVDRSGGLCYTTPYGGAAAKTSPHPSVRQHRRSRSRPGTGADARPHREES